MAGGKLRQKVKNKALSILSGGARVLQDPPAIEGDQEEVRQTFSEPPAGLAAPVVTEVSLFQADAFADLRRKVSALSTELQAVNKRTDSNLAQFDELGKSAALELVQVRRALEAGTERMSALRKDIEIAASAITELQQSLQALNSEARTRTRKQDEAVSNVQREVWQVKLDMESAFADSEKLLATIAEVRTTCTAAEARSATAADAAKQISDELAPVKTLLYIVSGVLVIALIVIVAVALKM